MDIMYSDALTNTKLISVSTTTINAATATAIDDDSRQEHGAPRTHAPLRLRLHSSNNFARSNGMSKHKQLVPEHRSAPHRMSINFGGVVRACVPAVAVRWCDGI